MRRTARLLVVPLSLALLALAVSVPITAAGNKPGNSPNAKLCQKGGWTGLATPLGESFASEAACVSFAAQNPGFGFNAKFDIDGPSAEGLRNPTATIFTAGNITGMFEAPGGGGFYECRTFGLPPNDMPCSGTVTYGVRVSVFVTSAGSDYGQSAPVVTCPDGSMPTAVDRETYWYASCNFLATGYWRVAITF